MAHSRAPASTRARLIEAAGRAMLEQGCEGVSMDAVRLAAGVSNGSLYHHFPTKAHLAAALYLETLRDFHAALLAPLATEPEAERGVRGLVRAYVAWVEAHPGPARLLHRLRRSGELEGLEGAWQAPNDATFAALGAWVSGRVAAGEMRRLPFAVWMALVFAPAYSLTPQWLEQTPPAVPSGVRRALEDAAWSSVARQ